MPLIVKCPNGCQLRVPASRAGKVVRCPGCKAIIKIDPISKAEVTEQVVTASKATADSINTKKRERAERLPTIEVISRGNRQRQADDGEVEIQIDESGVVRRSATGIELQTRAHHSRDDRVLLAKIFASLLCVVALINMVPMTYSWFRWAQYGEPFALSRWMYLQVFVASLHLIYAVFLVQIPDWSALRTVAIAMLTLAVAFGTISTGLLVGQGQGAISEFLEIPFSLTTRASIWCVAMLCLSTLISYLAGREASNWRRTEKLLREIMLSRSEMGVNA